MKIDKEIKRQVIRDFYDKKLTKGETIIELNSKGFEVEDKATAFMIGMMKKEDFDYHDKDKLMLTIHSKQGVYCFDISKEFFQEMKRKLFYFEKIHLEERFELMNEDIKSKDIEWRLRK